MTIDRVTLEVLNHYFRAAAEACGYTLERTAYTTFIKESQDFTTGLLTPGGEQFAYPVAIGAQSYIGINYLPFIEALAPWHHGDIGVANCPYATKGASTHLPDYHLMKPIFSGGRLLGFAWAFIHSSDMGGIVAGSIQPSAYELFQEGLRITPKKLYREGRLQDDVKDFLLSNVRIPDKNWGDINAVIAGLGIAERRVQQAVTKWGMATVEAGRDALLDYAEERARALISGFPDGVFVFEDFLEDDYVSDLPVRVKLTVSKEGADRLHFDFTGTDPQLAAAFNLATNGRHPFLCVAMFAFFRSLEPSIPVNGGLIRPIRFTAPEGSVVNATFPAATGVRYAVTQLIFTIVQGILCQGFSDIVPAGGASQATIPAISTWDSRSGKRHVTVIQPMIGGSGGRPSADGVEGCDFSLGSLRNTPTESLENEAPIRVREYSVLPDTGGPGLRRGGNALRLDFQVFHPDTIFTARGMEKLKFQPWGLLGGGPGACGDCWLNPDTAEARRLGKVDSVRLTAGDIVSLRTPGGGGYGDPLQRDPEFVRRDVSDGFISMQAARDKYGVVLQGERVEVVETEQIRRQQRTTTSRDGIFDMGEARTAYLSAFPSPLQDRIVTLVFALPIHERYHARRALFAVLRRKAAVVDVIDEAVLMSAWNELRGNG